MEEVLFRSSGISEGEGRENIAKGSVPFCLPKSGFMQLHNDRLVENLAAPKWRWNTD